MQLLRARTLTAVHCGARGGSAEAQPWSVSGVAQVHGGARPDVHRHPVGGIEQVAAADDRDGLVLERLVGRRVTEAWRRAWIDGGALIGRWQGERRHVPPVRADERLDLARDRQPVLR